MLEFYFFLQRRQSLDLLGSLELECFLLVEEGPFLFLRHEVGFVAVAVQFEGSAHFIILLILAYNSIEFAVAFIFN